MLKTCSLKSTKVTVTFLSMWTSQVSDPCTIKHYNLEREAISSGSGHQDDKSTKTWKNIGNKQAREQSHTPPNIATAILLAVALTSFGQNTLVGWQTTGSNNSRQPLLQPNTSGVKSTCHWEVSGKLAFQITLSTTQSHPALLLGGSQIMFYEPIFHDHSKATT